MTVFDPSLVEEAFGDDSDGLGMFLESVCGSVRKGFDRVRAAIGTEDYIELRQAAHALRGSSGHIGGAEVAAIAQLVETAAREGRSESLDTIDKLAAAIDRLEVEIGKYREKLAAG